MRWGASLSAFLHLALVLVVYFGLPSLYEPEAMVEHVIPVEFYTVAEVTSLPPPAPEPEPIEESKLEPEAVPEPESEPVPPAPVEAAAEPPPAPQPVTAPEPVAETTSPSPPKPEPRKVLPAPPPKPVRTAKRKAPPPKPKPKTTDASFGSLLKDLVSTPQPQPAKPSDDAKKAKPKEPPEVQVPLVRVAAARNEPLSLSVVDAIRRQVEDNWNPPIGAPDAGDLVVEIRIVLQPDGTVTGAQIVDRLCRTGPVKTLSCIMAESAVRAVWRASPLQNLPPEKYKQWREISFTFKPPA